MENKIINKEGCNLLVESPVFSGTTKDLDECPTKLEINNTKKLIVLTPDILSDGVNTKNYDSDQLVEIEDVGRYLKCTYTNDCAEWCKFSFYNSGVSGSLTNSFYIFNNDDIVSGESEIGLTQNFVNTSWDSSLEIMVYLNVTYAQQCSINDLPATRFDGGFLWNTSDSATIKNAILNGDINIVISEEAVIYKLVPSISEGNITLEHGVESQITLSYNKYVGGVLNESVDVTNSALWTSSDETVATVNNGLVIVNNSGKPGPVTITATYEDQIVSWTINIASYQLEIKTITEGKIYKKGSIAYNSYFIEFLNGVEKSRSNATGKTTWTSSDDTIAYHSLAGTFTSIESGNVVVTAAYVKNDITYTATTDLIILANYITITPTSHIFEQEGGEVVINVEYGGNVYSTKDSLTWLSNVKSGNTVITIATANTDSSDRSGVVTFTCGDAIAEFNVLQYGTQTHPTITLNRSSYTFDYNGGSVQNYAVLTDADTYAIKNIPDWITVNKRTCSSGEIITFTTSKNTNVDASREIDIIFYIPGTNVQSIFTIKQEAFPEIPEVSVTLSALNTSLDRVEGVNGKPSLITITAEYSDGTTKIVTDNDNLTYSIISGYQWVCGFNKGVITHNGAGTAVLEFTYTEDGQSASTQLTVVTKPVQLIDLELSSSQNITLKLGTTLTVTAKDVYNNDRKLDSTTALWTSNNPSIASVSVDNGVATITAVSAGTTFVNVVSTYNNVTIGKTIYIEVVSSSATVIDLEFDIQTEDHFSVPGIVQSARDYNLIAVLKSDGVVVTDVTSMCAWTSSNTNVAQVNNGVVTTGRISGTTVITAKYVFGTTAYEKSIIIHVIGQEYYVVATTNIEKVGNLNNVQLKIKLNNGQIISQLYSWECIGGSDSHLVGKTGKGTITYDDTTGTTKNVIMKLTSVSPYYNFVGDLVYPGAECTLIVPQNWSII